MAIRFADRVSRIRASGIRAVFDRARQIPDAIDLSIGQGDFDVPRPVKDATIAAIEEGSGHYSATEGFPDVVEAVATHLRARVELCPGDHVMVTSGAIGAIHLALAALSGPGDEVLCPDPFFVAYQALVLLSGAEPVFYDLHPSFELDVGRIAELITPRTRVLLLNSPQNPTGAVYSRDQVEALADLCERRGVVVISDELYELFTYEGVHTSIKRFGGVTSVLVGGVSKSHGMAGWRLGWAAGPPELVEKMRTLQQFIYTCAPTLVQRGVLAAFGVDLLPEVCRYRNKAKRAYEALVEAGYEVVRPRGSFFIYPRVPRGDDITFCEEALARKLILVPGRAFSRRTDHFRICFGVSDEKLERGIEVLSALRG